MKLTSVAVLCLSLLLVHTHFSLAMRRRGGRGKSSFGSGKSSSRGSNSTSSHSSTKTGRRTNQGYPNQYPARHLGGYGGSYGGYGVGYMNHNPGNQILSPRLGGAYGYGGYGGDGVSPFVRSVQGMGMGPSLKSRSFGRSAVMAAGAGAVAGMALGYGLGRFPRPPFHFHSPQEEYYYNHYMYKRYGTKSTDVNDYSRDYKFSPPPVTYDNYMDNCMKRTDLLLEENRQGKNEPITTTTTTTTTITTATVVTSAPDNGTSNNTSESNSTAADEALNPAPSTPSPPNQPEANPVPPASQDVGTDDSDDDTVSIVEIGYPALIQQLKARRCVGLYMEFSAAYLQKQTQDKDPGPSGGVQGQAEAVTDVPQKSNMSASGV